LSAIRAPRLASLRDWYSDELPPLHSFRSSCEGRIHGACETAMVLAAGYGERMRP
jgi:hypothetical protein